MNSMEKGEIRNNTVGKGFQLCGMEHRSITLSINSTECTTLVNFLYDFKLVFYGKYTLSLS